MAYCATEPADAEAALAEALDAAALAELLAAALADADADSLPDAALDDACDEPQPAKAPTANTPHTITAKKPAAAFFIPFPFP